MSNVGDSLEKNLAEQLGIPSNPSVLVVGSGAREHAIIWKAAQSAHQPKLYAAPGNPGMAEIAECVPISASDIAGLVAFAKKTQIDLVVVGPEVPLSLGLVDACEEAGILAFGPTKAAAQLEASKALAKDLMREAGVPTASYAVFDNAENAKTYIEGHGAPVVVKADGLAAGKGVVVALTVQEALAAVDEMMVNKRFGDSGGRVVIESYLEGPEVSMMFFVDANTCVPMLPARDYKRIYEENQGPNTGGMGSICPVPGLGEALFEEVEEKIVQPVIQALRNRGIVYKGVLYAGLMMTKDGPYVIEFNCRFGDPETEAVLPLLDSDLLEVMWSVCKDGLTDVDLTFSMDHAVCVVLAAEGYPEAPRSGDVIDLYHTVTEGVGLNAEAQLAGQSGPKGTNEATRISGQGRMVFHAGTVMQNGQLVTAGGRVIAVVGRGTDFDSARTDAYRVADQIYFSGKHVRRDIARNL